MYFSTLLNFGLFGEEIHNANKISKHYYLCNPHCSSKYIYKNRNINFYYIFYQIHPQMLNMLIMYRPTSNKTIFFFTMSLIHISFDQNILTTTVSSNSTW